MAPVAQVMTTRSLPVTPPPAMTDRALGAGATAQPLGVLLLPTLKMKLLATLASVRPEWSTPADKSIMMPLMPLS